MHDLETKLAGDFFLKLFELIRAEFDHVTRLDVDQVTVVGLRNGLVTPAAIAEVMSLDDSFALEELHRSVHRCERDPWIDGRYATVKFADVRVIGGLAEHPRDDPPSPRHPQSVFAASAFHRFGSTLHASRCCQSYLPLMISGDRDWMLSN